jgi:hypothetical protein
MHRKTLNTLIVCAFLFAPAIAHAQDFISGITGPEQSEEDKGPKVINQYSQRFKKDFSAETKGNILPRHFFVMNFVQSPDADSDTATLRIASPLTLNGCVKLTPPVIESTDNGRTLRISVVPPVADVDRSVKHPHYDCKQGAFVAQADVSLSREDLEAQDVRQIAFKVDNITDYYLVELSPHELALTPRTMRAFKPRAVPGKLDSMRFRFYPDNTIVLSLPGSTAETPDVKTKLAAFAAGQGLNPLAETIPAFASPESQNASYKNSFYYIDPSNNLTNDLAANENRKLGTIDIPADFKGPEGAYQVRNQLEVYARRPGLYD